MVEVYLDIVGLHNHRGQWTEVRCTMTLGNEVCLGISVAEVYLMCVPPETRQLNTMFLHQDHKIWMVFLM